MRDPEHAQTYGVGIKELWEVPAGRVAKGEVIYTLGYPLTSQEYGGAWIYGISDTLLSVGYVVGLDYQDPRLDPHHVFQSFKQHRSGAAPSRGRKDGPLRRQEPALWRMAHDAETGRQGLDDPGRLGQHAQLAAAQGNPPGDQERDAGGGNGLRIDAWWGTTRAGLSSAYQSRVEGSWIKEELYPVRNFHQGFEHGLLPGLVHSGVQQVLGGRNLGPDFKNHAGYRNMRHLDAIGRSTYGREATLGPAKSDGKLTFDKLTDVYHSGTRHEDDQPVHLVIRDTDICNHRCVAGIWQPVPAFLPGGGVRDGGRADPHQLRQLRPLQDLRHHGPLPGHHLGAARRGRRAEL